MVYAIAHLNVTDPESLSAYRGVASEALARHGGKVVQASTDLSALDGTPDLPHGIAVLTFETTEGANAWINDPDLADVHALRRKIGRVDITLLG
ncbi:MAG: DUF1330 domain-containing protein [Roseovarius sp.]